MALFKKLNSQKLALLNKKTAPLEKIIQIMTEDNLGAVFGLKFIKTEFPVENLYIDTLAFDAESKSFVIIEYKKDRSFSVIDQGFAYLSLMLSNKAEFVLALQKTDGKTYEKKDINWSQSRVIFVSPQFTQHQSLAINFKDLPIELWKIEFFEDSLVLYDQVQASNANSSIKAISKSNAIVQRVSREVRKYSIDDHFKDSWDNSRDLFEKIRNKIIDFDPRIVEKVNQYYIGYKIGNYNLCTINVYKSKLDLKLIRVDKKELRDPWKKIVSIDWKKLGFGKQCSYVLTTPDDIDYALVLIKQVYKKFYK